VRGLHFGLRRKIKPFLLVFLSLQLFWTFYCVNVFHFLSVDDARAESRLAQLKQGFLHQKITKKELSCKRARLAAVILI
jgi:hypothetical protein